MQTKSLTLGFLTALVLLPLAALAAAPVPGDLDTSFDPGSGANDRVLGIARQSDGKLVVVGRFTLFNSTAPQYRRRVVRLNTDGTVDATFNVTAGVLGYGADAHVNAVALTPDGKIVIVGDFASYNGASRAKVARLNADGTLDTDFTPPAVGPNATVAAATSTRVRALVFSMWCARSLSQRRPSRAIGERIVPSRNRWRGPWRDHPSRLPQHSSSAFDR